MKELKFVNDDNKEELQGTLNRTMKELKSIDNRLAELAQEALNRTMKELKFGRVNGKRLMMHS